MVAATGGAGGPGYACPLVPPDELLKFGQDVMADCKAKAMIIIGEVREVAAKKDAEHAAAIAAHEEAIGSLQQQICDLMDKIPATANSGDPQPQQQQQPQPQQQH